jgi:hypothetical protein
MRKVFATLAVAMLMAAPAMAELSMTPTVVDPSWITVTPIGEGLRTTTMYVNGTENLYDNMASAFGVTGSSPYTNGVTAGAATFVLDDMHFAAPSNTISHVHFLYYNPGAGGTLMSPSTDVLAFFSNPGGLNTAVGATLALYSFMAPTGFFLFSLNISGAPAVVGQDVWMGYNKSLTTFWTGGGQPVTFGTGTNIGALGFSPTTISPSLFTTFMGAPAPGSLHWAVGGVPEPVTITLLAIGGLVSLRRRK